MYDYSKFGTIADSLKPTYENVTREFITGTMKKILFSEEMPNFNFEFKENEAIEFIENVWNSYTSKYDFLKEDESKVINAIKQKNDIDDTINEKPSLIINDYKNFFELLRQYYEKDIELYFKRTGASGFAVYEKDNCFEQIWLRATSNDFNNPESFLKKNVDIINDETFEKYSEETLLGKSKNLNDNIICVKNSIAKPWDETPRKFEIIIYDKEYYENKELFDRPQYKLPVIRYGIYEKENKKICYIGAIQNPKVCYSEAVLKIKNGKNNLNKVSKDFTRKKYKLNKGIFESESIEYKRYVEKNKTIDKTIDKTNNNVNKQISPPENISEVEPSHLLALSIFVSFLHKEGITDIEVPNGYVLDYEYHQKRNIIMKKQFEEEWSEYKRKEWPEEYIINKKLVDNELNKEDLIIKNKTEKFRRTFMRLMYHYPKSKINNDNDNEKSDKTLHINIPVVKSLEDIKGDMLEETYSSVNDLNKEDKELLR